MVFKTFCFDIDKSDYTLAKFTSDSGLVFPLVYNEPTVSIAPFQRVSGQVQNWVAKSLLGEWGQVADLHNVQETLSYILKNWTHGDIFYVYTVHGSPVGFVAMDEKNWYPYMSHLYVGNEHRNSGHATKLIEFCKHYTQHRCHSEYRLYCEPRMVPFYTKRGFSITEPNTSDLIIMKRLVRL